MGIDFHVFNFLASTKNQEFKKTLTIGRQSIHLSSKDISILAKKHKALWNIRDNLIVEEFIDFVLVKHFGATSVKSLDYSDYEKASITHDLNQPVDKSLHGKFDTIIDSGSLEHIFDIKKAFENCMNLCKVGGQIFHISPADNFSGHGFWQISPELFFSLYSAKNGFQIEEIYIASLSNKSKVFKILRPKAGHRITLYSTSPCYILVKARKINDVNILSVQQSDYEHIWENPIPQQNLKG